MCEQHRTKLKDGMVKFGSIVERIRKSMFSNALKRNDDVVPDDQLNRERRELGGRDV